MSTSLNVVNMALTFWASFRRWAIRKRIRFILTRYSDRVPDISLVGSDGGTLTVATCGLDTWGAATGGAAALGGGGGGGAWVDCGGGVTGALAAATGAGAATGSAALGVSSTLGAALAGAADASYQTTQNIKNTCK